MAYLVTRFIDRANMRKSKHLINRSRYAWVLVVLAPLFAQGSTVKQDETVILFPTSGYVDDQGLWVVPLHGWIFEYEHDSLWRRAGVNALLKSLQLNHVSLENELFKERAWMFLVDNERGKKIPITVNGQTFLCAKSKANGHFQGEARFEAAGQFDPRKAGWITYPVALAVGDTRRFEGETQLLPKEGLSVVSDIDDTIKDSHVADKSELMKNTFLKEFHAVNAMAEVYTRWQAAGAAFHYLSASPWQLYPSLAQFINDNGFPKGDFYLRQFRIKDSSFYELFTSPFDYKTKTIEALFIKYPQRKFILVGDSTESDPEVYTYIAKKFPRQTVKILIRKVPGSPGGKHIEQAFTGLESDLWMVFVEPVELKNLALDSVFSLRR